MLYGQVKKQHIHFGLGYFGKPRHLSREEKWFYIKAIDEELSEYVSAITLEDEYDAVLDILVFAIGLMLRHGFPPEGIKEVVDANMNKVIGPQTKRGGFKLDLIKPEGWKAPDLKEFLK